MLRRTLIGGSLAAALLFSTAPVLALTEGKHFVRLPNPIPSAEGTVIKVSGYGCKFCYQYALHIDRALMAKVPDLRFVPWHMKEMGEHGMLCSELWAVALVQDEARKLSPLDPASAFHKVEMRTFEDYHIRRERFSGKPGDFLASGLEALGMTPDEFEKARKDFRVQSILKRWDSALEIGSMEGVPAFVVNGKYLIRPEGITSLDALAETIRTLSKQ